MSFYLMFHLKNVFVVLNIARFMHYHFSITYALGRALPPSAMGRRGIPRERFLWRTIRVMGIHQNFILASSDCMLACSSYDSLIG